MILLHSSSIKITLTIINANQFVIVRNVSNRKLKMLNLCELQSFNLCFGREICINVGTYLKKRILFESISQYHEILTYAP